MGAAALYTISGIEGEQRGRYKRSPNSAGAPQGRPRRRRHGRQDRDLRCQSAAELRADLKRLRRDTDSGRTVSSPASSSISAPSQTADPSSSVVTSLPASSPSSGRSATHPSSSSAIVEVASRNKGKFLSLVAFLLLLLLSAGYGAYHLFRRATVEAPSKITKISHWNKSMDRVVLSPDGRTVAFTSPTDGYDQIFVMPLLAANRFSSPGTKATKTSSISRSTAMNSISAAPWVIRRFGPSPLSATLTCGMAVDDKKCTPLKTGFSTFLVMFAPDAKSFDYTVSSRTETTIFRPPWHNGSLAVPAVPAIKLPFAMREDYSGNAFAVSYDLSSIVYARPSGHDDLYLLSTK